MTLAKPALTRQPYIALVNAGRNEWFIATLVTASAFLLYFRTLSPSVLAGDSGEFQFAAWGWTLAHPTGYPLYLIVGGLWQHLFPFGDPAYRLNLFSAVLSALTVGVCFLVFLRTARHRAAALIAVFTFAVSQTFWSQATRAEVYALNMFFIALLTFLAMEWREQPSSKFAAGFALTFGLALAHHRSILLVAPAFAALLGDSILAIVAHAREKDIRPLLKHSLLYVLLTLLPLFLYLYLPLRGAATPYMAINVSPTTVINTFENTSGAWLEYALGQRFQSELVFNNASFAELRGVLARLIAEFNPLGVAIGVAGVGILFWQMRTQLAAFVLFGLGSFLLFNSSYHIGDISDLYTPIYFFFAVGIAAGLGAIQDFIENQKYLTKSYFPLIIMLGLTAALPISNLVAAFPQEDHSLNQEERFRAEELLRSAPQDAILISNDRDEMMPLWYLQLVEGQRHDVLALFPQIAPGKQYENVVSLTESVLHSGRPVFATKSLPSLLLKYQVDAGFDVLFPISEVSEPAPQYPSQATIGEVLRVIGYTIHGGILERGTESDVTVYWKPIKQMTRDYKTSLQIYDAEGNKVAQGDDHTPGDLEYPSSHWRSGEVLMDHFKVLLPAILKSGDYKLFVQVYDEASGENLGDLTEIGTEVIE